jgi:hypothetical protein
LVEPSAPLDLGTKVHERPTVGVDAGAVANTTDEVKTDTHADHLHPLGGHGPGADEVEDVVGSLAE